MMGATPPCSMSSITMIAKIANIHNTIEKNDLVDV
jgi:hypothetical protein